MTTPDRPDLYAQSGVNYEKLDPAKVAFQRHSSSTFGNIEDLGYKFVRESVGEQAQVYDLGPFYVAQTIEGLGTKSLIAQAVREKAGPSHFDKIARDANAAIINDLICVGAVPVGIGAYFAVGDAEWFSDMQRTEDLARGFAEASNDAGIVWGGGETPSLSGVIYPTSIDIAGGAFGVISPKKDLIMPRKLKAGDQIVTINSSGVHANGLSRARKIAQDLPEGYETKLNSGQTFGDALLTPSAIYAKFVHDAVDQADVHYIVNITGHGLRKIMRAPQDFTYVIDCLPRAQEVFSFMQENGGETDEQMYGTFNMGAGLALFVPKNFVQRVFTAAWLNGFEPLLAGHVEKGPKQVIIQPRGIVFEGDSLQIR